MFRLELDSFLVSESNKEEFLTTLLQFSQLFAHDITVRLREKVIKEKEEVKVKHISADKFSLIDR